MLTIYKRLEPTSLGIEQKTLTLDEELELYLRYSDIKTNRKHIFITNNLDKLNYMTKYIDIRDFLPLYLESGFLENYLTEKMIENLIHGNLRNSIDITGLVSDKFNFHTEIIKKKIWKKNKNLSSELLFNIAYRIPNFTTKVTSQKINKEFFMESSGKIYCSLLNYQKLENASEFNEITTYTKEYPEHKHTCYICKNPFSKICVFDNNQSICYSCGCFNYKMSKSKADMTSIRAYVSGCRHTIGYYIVLNILRNGGFVVGSTRFPRCAQLNYSLEPDYESFKSRLIIEKCDYTDLSQVNMMIGRLVNHNINTFINNAFHTVRQSDNYYEKVNFLENKLSDENLVGITSSGMTSSLINFMESNQITINKFNNIHDDTNYKTQWTQTLTETDTSEIFEANLINQIVPTILFQKIISMWEQRQGSQYFLINVSSTESFHCTPTHIVTSMCKIAIDNLIDRVRIGLPSSFTAYSADPGFVTGVINSKDKPLSCQDGAIRVLKPLIDKLNGIDNVPSKLNSIFYKNYKLESKINY